MLSVNFGAINYEFTKLQPCVFAEAEKVGAGQERTADLVSPNEQFCCLRCVWNEQFCCLHCVWNEQFSCLRCVSCQSFELREPYHNGNRESPSAKACLNQAIWIHFPLMRHIAKAFLYTFPHSTSPRWQSCSASVRSRGAFFCPGPTRCRAWAIPSGQSQHLIGWELIERIEWSQTMIVVCTVIILACSNPAMTSHLRKIRDVKIAVRSHPAGCSRTCISRSGTGRFVLSAFTNSACQFTSPSISSSGVDRETQMLESCDDERFEIGFSRRSTAYLPVHASVGRSEMVSQIGPVNSASRNMIMLRALNVDPKAYLSDAWIQPSLADSNRL
jgi:hypothetical protein